MAETIKTNFRQRLEEISPILKDVAMGDYSRTIPIPGEDDDLTEHLVALNIVIEDLREMHRTEQKRIGEIKAKNDELTRSQTAMLYMVEDLNEQAGKLKESEGRYRSVVNALAEGIVLQNAEGVIIATNASADRILGRTVKEIKGRTSEDPVWGAIHEDGTTFTGDTHPAMVTLSTGEPQIGVVMGLVDADGSITWISINSQPIMREGQGRPYAVVTSFLDITRRKLAEEALRKSEEKYRNVVETALEAVWFLDGEFKTTEVNDVAVQMLGYGREELIGRPFIDLLFEEDRPAQIREFGRRKRGASGRYERRIRCKDGGEKWLFFSAKGITDASGAFTGSFALITDITERKEAEKELKKIEERYRVLFKS